MTNRCVIYIRVSNHIQTTDNQIIQLKRVADLKALNIFDTFIDEAISGSKDRGIRTY